MEWADFHVVEVMSAKKFIYKRIGYLAASLILEQTSPVLLLATNLIKKDLQSNDSSEVFIALTGLGNILNAGLARNVLDDLAVLTCHSTAKIRKKSLIVFTRALGYSNTDTEKYLHRIIDRLYDTEKGSILFFIIRGDLT